MVKYSQAFLLRWSSPEYLWPWAGTSILATFNIPDFSVIALLLRNCPKCDQIMSLYDSSAFTFIAFKIHENQEDSHLKHFQDQYYNLSTNLLKFNIERKHYIKNWVITED